MHSQKFQQNFWRNYKWTYLYLCTDNFYYYEREVHNFNWQGLGGWPKSIPHIVLVVHLHNLHAKPQLIMIIIIDCFLDLHSLTSFTKISVEFFPHIWEFLKVSLHNYGWFHIEKSTNWTKNRFNKTVSKMSILNTNIDNGKLLGILMSNNM